MKYIGIVDEIKQEHQSGFYGRIPSTNSKIEKILDELSSISSGNIKVGNIGIEVGPPNIILLLNKFFKRNQKITLQQKIETDKGKVLIIENDALNNNYRFENKLMYGLFDDFYDKELAFNRIMNSKGGSELSIVERKDVIDIFKHNYNGHFSEGIYIIHPKNNKILIPLNNSHKLIQTLILEETISAYVDLGAKSIEIIDLTNYDLKINSKLEKAEVNADFSNLKEILRKKEYGFGTFSPENALKDKYFIQDIPAVMTTINSRINGNQLIDNFTETINLNMGLDVKVLDLFKTGASYNYFRKWSFNVEFYDKMEI